jgi:hypothetical protein
MLLPHDGIHDHAEPRRMPEFAIVAQDPDYVRRNAAEFVFGSQAFTLIGLPDTQNYSSGFPQIYEAQTAWVVDQRAALDIRYVSHYGDIVNNADQPQQWVNADGAMRLLDDAGMIYGVCPGNHDITSSGGSGQPVIRDSYLSYFGPTAARFQGKPWYGGASPSGMSSYTLFSGGGIDFLQIHLDCDTPVRELAWAQAVIDANRDRPVMLTTHRYLQDAEDYTSGVPIVPSGRYPDIWYSVEGLYNPDGIRSEEFFLWFVRRNPGVFMVTCGHFHEEFRQVSQNVAGLPVHEVLADYQDDPNGGDGWMRIMKFDTLANVIDVDTYSPTLAAVRTAAESDFTLSVEFDRYRLAPGTSFKAFQPGIGGYAGTQDTWVSQENPNSSYGNNDVRVSDDDTANSFFADYRGQALLRFDGVVGGAGIPAGSEILSATLVVDITDDIDTPLYNPVFYVHQVVRPWDEASTWNSLSGGLTVGADLAPAFAQFSGDNNPDQDTMRRIDVTSLVNAWMQGAPNWGVAIMPQIISGNDDGIEIVASENGNAMLRPRLEVTFRAPVPPNPYDLDGNGQVDGADLGRLLAEWGSPSPIADLDNDGTVNGADLGIMLANWA